ncbi:hypothetical protein [Bacteroides faecichinchillae]|nr:hypothetical protein [Bacteroides faecichinchillae]
MASCINKLNKAIMFGCAGGATGLAELLLVNLSDVQSITITNNEVTALTLVANAKAVPVDCYKNSVKMIDAIRQLDGATGLEQSVTVTVYDKTVDGANIIEALLNGKFIAFGKLRELGAIKVAGASAGLESSASDSDTSSNGGFMTITLKTPDGSKGDSPTVCSSSVWSYLVANKLNV